LTNTRNKRLLRIIAGGCVVSLMYTSTLFTSIFSNKITEEEELQKIRQLALSVDHGDGTCKWMPPAYEIPEFLNFYKTIIAGYPSGDKRLAYMQLEGLTGWSAKDEWDFEFLGMSNHPFIKVNYPHHEGNWVWEDVGDQVIMVLRDMRQSMMEYHDILWDIGYAKTREEAYSKIDDLYRTVPPHIEQFLKWRDERVMDEIHWYGWFIDYWMEAGLLRDIFTHKITTTEHWDLLMNSEDLNKKGVKYDTIVGNTTVTPVYDPNCLNNVSGGCQPVQVISAARLYDLEAGPAEGRKIALALKGKEGIDQYLIDESVWECIWRELVVNKKGYKTFQDREGLDQRDYNFGPEMLEEMVVELTRLIDKYSSNVPPDNWYELQTAKDLVDMLTENRASIELELVEVNSHRRLLTEEDFLGPIEREKRRAKSLALILKEKGKEAYLSERKLDDEDFSDFFAKVERDLLKERVNKHKQESLEREAKRQNQKKMWSKTSA